MTAHYIPWIGASPSADSYNLILSALRGDRLGGETLSVTADLRSLAEALAQNAAAILAAASAEFRDEQLALARKAAMPKRF